MEAMSIERLLLAAWEEEGFIGRNRVPIGNSDVDALALNVHERRVRIGETKVRMTSQHVFTVDDHHLAQMESGNLGFEWWLGEDWSRWLNVLPKLWSDNGNPCVPWLLPIAEVNVIEVVFCCNLHILCDSTKASGLLRRSALSQFEKNPAVASYLKDITVNAKLMTTVGIAFSLACSIAKRIDEEGYGRRFGDPFKDMFRELHRYLRPHFQRIPCDASGAPLGSRKEPFAADLRKQTALGLLNALGVSSQEIQSWFSATST